MITNLDRLRLMRAGRDAWRAGQPSSAVPYSLIGGRVEAARAAVWIRGYVLTRNVDAEQRQKRSPV